MSLPISARLRASLLATTAITAAALAGPAIVLIAPTAAMAANECGDPTANGATADALTCPPGTYPTGIIYSTDGDLTLSLQESAAGAVNTTTGGIQVTGNGGDAVTLKRTGGGDGGDPSLVNTTLSAVGVTTAGGNATIDFTDPDGNDTGIVLTGGAGSTVLSATTGGAGSVTIVMPNNGKISGGAIGIGVNAGNAATISTGAVTATDTGVLVVAQTGAVSVNGNGSGSIIAGTGAAVNAQITNAANANAVTVTLGDGKTVSSTGTSAIIAQSAGAGDVIVTTGKNEKFSGIDTVLVANATGGNASVTTGDGVTISSIDTDADGTGGISATSNRAADSAPGTSTATVTVGKTNVITVDATKGAPGFGVSVANTNAAGTGSATVNLTDALTISVTGNAGGVGISALTAGGGDASIVLATATNGKGLISVTGKAVGAFNDGINIASLGGGDVKVDEATDITATNVGGLGARGIVASVVGSGTISINANGAINVTNGVGVLTTADKGTTTITSANEINATDDAIRVTSGDGFYTINVNGSATSSGASAIQASGNSGGAINVGDKASVRGLGTSPATALIDITAPSGKTTTITNAGFIVSVNPVVGGAQGDLAIKAVGGNVVLNNANQLTGVLDFTGLAAGNTVIFNNTGGVGWHSTGTTKFSNGNDTLNNTKGGLVSTIGATTIDFGADTGAPRDVFNNAGTVVTGETTGASTLTLAGLETFNNSGALIFGSANAKASDGQTNDRIVMTGSGVGTAYVGSGAGTLILDANLGGITTQTNCAAAVNADCLSLPGGTISGVTLVRVTNTGTTPSGLNTTGVVIAEAGAIAPGSFLIDPASANYVTRGGAGAIDAGLFFFRLVPVGTTQEALVSAPDGEVFEFTQLGSQLTDIWQTTTGTWFDRQADLRESVGGSDQEAGVAGWAKVVGTTGRRTSSQSYTSLGTTFNFDTSYRQTTWAIIGGFDLIRGSAASGTWVFGIDAGYVRSNARIRLDGTRALYSGGVVGAYASWVKNGWFVDATVNADFLSINYTLPTINGPASSGDAKTIGGQLEAGWRVPLGSVFFVEPTASLSYARGSIDDLTVVGGTAHFGDTDSFRGSFGGRIGGDIDSGDIHLKGALTAKLWDEFQGGQNVTLTNAGPTIPMSDKFDGVFGEVGGQAEAFSDNGRVSAFLNVGYRFQSDYHTVTTTAGVRFQF